LLSGCSLSLFNNFKPLPEAAGNRKDVFSWFQGDTNRFLFQSYIDIYSNHFSGLMFIKPLNGNSHRTVFITEVGIKIFDMEFFRNGDFKLYYCMEELNRKTIINTLKNDIGIMLNNIPENGTWKMMQEKNDGRIIIKSKYYNGVRYCFINKKTNKVDELIQTGAFLKKVNMRFYSTDGAEIDSINISHYNLKLKIHLSKLYETLPEISE
jgi:hypothetical protein